MCHPAVPFVNREAFIVHRRWIVVQGTGHASRQVRGGGDGGGSGESSSVKRCVCSPSQHPGSFRCRLHHGEYVWRGRAIK
ncbi:hypothetical protein RJT34_27069 [Clitoria ternatea]|uniref:Uncharacterized protein n=1 Tax=Clitoria ternatea TaxID=43366 RepID=A0AAN9F7V0_CLITE